MPVLKYISLLNFYTQTIFIPSIKPIIIVYQPWKNIVVQIINSSSCLDSAYSNIVLLRAIKYLSINDILFLYLSMKTNECKTISKEQGKGKFENKQKQSKNQLTFKGDNSSLAKQRYEYMEDELVWAKIIGYPWWPGIVIKKNFPSYCLSGQGVMQKRVMTYEVSFFGENSHAQVEQTKLAQYLVNRSYYLQYSTKYQRKEYYRKYLEAIGEADSICNNIGQFFAFQSHDQLHSEINAQNSQEKKILKLQQNKQKRINKNVKNNACKSATHIEEKDQAQMRKYTASKLLKILKQRLSSYSILSLKKTILNILRKHQTKEFQSKAQAMQTYLTLLRNIQQMSESQIIKRHMPKQYHNIVNNTIFLSPSKSEITIADVNEVILHQNIQNKRTYYQVNENSKLNYCKQQQIKEVQISYLS